MAKHQHNISNTPSRTGGDGGYRRNYHSQSPLLGRIHAQDKRSLQGIREHNDRAHQRPHGIYAVRSVKRYAVQNPRPH